MMFTTQARRQALHYPIKTVSSTTSLSLISMLLVSLLLAILLAFDKTIFSILIVGGFSGFGLYSLGRNDLGNWFSVVCFFCGAESILRNGLPAAYMFFFLYILLSGLLFLFIRSSNQRLKIFSATGLMLLLALLHFVHLDLAEIRFGIGKWGLIWSAVFFGMWISQSVELNLYFYRCIWYFMLGSVTVLFSFLMAPQYFAGRYWPTFDGTGPVAAAIGLLVLILLHHFDVKRWFSLRNILVAGLVTTSIVALVMLGSRGTFLALAVSMLFFLFTIGGFWNKVLIAISIASLMWLVYYVDQSSVGNNVLSSRIKEATEEDTREGRRFINSAVLLSFPEDPFFGKGTGSWRHLNNEYIAAVFDRRYPKDLLMADAHNTVLHLLFEHGIIGAGLFLAALFMLFRRSYKLVKFSRISVFPFLVFSLALGISTMHKQASMFLPFFLSVMVLYSQPVHRRKLLS